MEKKSAWYKYDKAAKKEVFDFAEKYRQFISENKTERECTRTAIEIAKAHGYRDLNDVIKSGETLKAGEKVYAINLDRACVLFNIGTEPMEYGMNILGAHIDSPRVDVKQNPLYEDSDLALLDTHYYGGIKKYQWVARSMSLHGMVALKGGKNIEISIGDKSGEPVFCITDLLIHLAADQMSKTAAKVIDAEAMDLLVGNIPFEIEGDEEKTDLVKKNILHILSEKYGFEEEDFQSAELEIVPAGDAKDLGFDSSMIIGYGHDDRVCAYPSLIAQVESDNLKKTGVCILVDKEEIGSMGATGMESKFFENTVAEVLNAMGDYSELKLRRTLANSKMLSSDVSSSFDPNYPGFFEKKNTAFVGKGVVFNKFTGARGKSGSSEAPAEFIAELREVLDAEEISYQLAELGKVDIGGGGTIAYIMANYGMKVIDCGVPVLNMHAPEEIISKVDVYEAYRCYKSFLASIN